MDCQDINNESSNSIPETLDLHYMSNNNSSSYNNYITTPPTPPPLPQKSLYYIYFIFSIISVWFTLESDTTLTSIFIKI